MTLEKLIQIVCEAVEKIMYLEKLEVRALVFDPKEGEAALTAAREISSRAQLLNFSSGEISDAPCDILIMDQIPASYLPKLALGLSDDPFSRLIVQMIVTGKKILVLSSETGLPVSAPASCRVLLETYQRLLKAHGIEFQDGGRTPALTIPAPALVPAERNMVAGGRVYRGNVLSRSELLEYAENGVITVAESVLITELARDTAKDKKITIKKVGEC